MLDSSLANSPTVTSDSPISKLFWGVIGSLITAFVINFLIKEKWQNRIRIKRIKKSSDKDLFKFYDLYESVFSEDVRISSEQFAHWIDIDKKNDGSKSVSHYHFICKRGSNVIGFLKTIYSWDYHLLFIAYYAIDKKDAQAREIASTTMIKHIEKILKKTLAACKGIIFEVETVDRKKSEEINTERKARIRLFKAAVKSRGHCAYEIDCNYIQPQIKIDNLDNSVDLPLVLMYISLYKDCSINLKLNKTEVIDIIYFIYFNIYLPYFISCGENFEKQETKLLSLLDRYHKKLPIRVPLKV